MNEVSTPVSPYLPAGSYLNSSSNIKVTLQADCVTADGKSTVTSTVTYTSADVAALRDIENRNGQLTLLKK